MEITPFYTIPPSVLTYTHSHTWNEASLWRGTCTSSFSTTCFCLSSFIDFILPLCLVCFSSAHLSCASDIPFFIITLCFHLNSLILFTSDVVYSPCNCSANWYRRWVLEYLRFVEIDRIKLLKQQKKEHDKRQKTAVVGDMRPLVDTLPTLELLLKEVSKVHQTKDEYAPWQLLHLHLSRMTLYNGRNFNTNVILISRRVHISRELCWANELNIPSTKVIWTLPWWIED